MSAQCMLLEVTRAMWRKGKEEDVGEERGRGEKGYEEKVKMGKGEKTKRRWEKGKKRRERRCNYKEGEEGWEVDWGKEVGGGGGEMKRGETMRRERVKH